MKIEPIAWSINKIINIRYLLTSANEVLRFYPSTGKFDLKPLNSHPDEDAVYDFCKFLQLNLQSLSDLNPDNVRKILWRNPIVLLESEEAINILTNFIISILSRPFQPMTSNDLKKMIHEQELPDQWLLKYLVLVHLKQTSNSSRAHFPKN